MTNIYAITKCAFRIIVLPLHLFPTRSPRSALHALDAPFTLPVAFRNLIQRRIQAIYMIADVTIVAQQESTLVCGRTAALTYSTIQTPPSALFHDIVHVWNARTVVMKTLSALTARQGRIFVLSAKTTATQAKIVFKNERIVQWGNYGHGMMVLVVTLNLTNRGLVSVVVIHVLRVLLVLVTAAVSSRIAILVLFAATVSVGATASRRTSVHVRT